MGDNFQHEYVELCVIQLECSFIYDDEQQIMYLAQFFFLFYFLLIGLVARLANGREYFSPLPPPFEPK